MEQHLNLASKAQAAEILPATAADLEEPHPAKQ
jgi:hypothetical protein